MRKEPKPSPTEAPLLFEVDPEPLLETLTALGGMPLVVQAFRSLGLPQSVREQVRVKARERGYDEATFVESFVILNAAGGECLDDFKRLRQDPGLAEMVGHALPSPEAARQFLYAFHAEEKIAEAQQRRLPGAIAYIPGGDGAAGGARAGEPGFGAGLRRPLSPAAPRHGGSGCHDHCEPQAAGTGHL